MRSEAPYTLLFDGECRVCAAFARVVRLVDLRRGLQVCSIQDSGGLLAAVPAEERLGAAHAVGPDGRVTSGAEAMPAIVAALTAGPRFEARLRSSRTSMVALEYIYRLMTEMRGRLSCATGVAPSAGRIPR